MAVTFNVFYNFLSALVDGGFDFGSDTFKVMLTNTSPVFTNQTYAQISGTELAPGNGYTTGGAASAMTLVNITGVITVTASDVSWVASGGMGPFRYPVLYDATTGNLIGWADYGSSLNLASGESFQTQWNSSSPSGILFSITML